MLGKKSRLTVKITPIDQWNAVFDPNGAVECGLPLRLGGFRGRADILRAATEGSGLRFGEGGAGQTNWPPQSGAASRIGGYAAALTASGFASWWRKVTARSAWAAAWTMARVSFFKTIIQLAM